jgi:hypothetical protein
LHRGPGRADGVSQADDGACPQHAANGVPGHEAARARRWDGPGGLVGSQVTEQGDGRSSDVAGHGEGTCGEGCEGDGGEAGADLAAGGGDVGDGGAELGVDACGDVAAGLSAGVNEERAHGVAAGARGDVGGVDNQEAVL